MPTEILPNHQEAWVELLKQQYREMFRSRKMIGVKRKEMAVDLEMLEKECSSLDVNMSRIDGLLHKLLGVELGSTVDMGFTPEDYA